jgi:hypothetical protein
MLTTIDCARAFVSVGMQYTATIETAGATTLTLDTSTLHVSAVEVLSEETGAVEQPVMMGAVHPTLGSALTVTLPSGLPLGACVMVGVRYTTDTTCSALQFLDPKMTAGVCGAAGNTHTHSLTHPPAKGGSHWHTASQT